jgi:hypothetical protein
MEIPRLPSEHESDQEEAITEGKSEVGQQGENRGFACDTDTLTLTDDLTTSSITGPTIVTGGSTKDFTTAPSIATFSFAPVCIKSVAPSVISDLAPALATTPALTITSALTTAPDKLGAKDKKLPGISTGITSGISTGITTTKTGIERSRFYACQRSPDSAPASAINIPAANPKGMSDARGINDHREDSLWDSHRSCGRSNFGQWHKWKEKTEGIHLSLAPDSPLTPPPDPPPDLPPASTPAPPSPAPPAASPPDPPPTATHPHRRETLTPTNKLKIGIEGWVQRKEMGITQGQGKMGGDNRDGDGEDDVVP